MSELTYLLLRIGFLALLWIFVFIAFFTIRSELFGPKVRALPKAKEPTPNIPTPSPTPAPAATAPPTRAPIDDPTDLFLDLDDDSEAATTSTPFVPNESGNSQFSAAQQPVARQLAVIDGPSAGISINLGSEPITIGRAPDCGLRISDDYTSNYHARLVRSGSDWYLEDTGSTNGTKLGGHSVQHSMRVSIGVPIQIGTNVLELRG